MADDKRRCPDDGTCHHECAGPCFRVLCCSPLSGVFPGDRWPTDLAAAHGVPAPAYDPTRDLAVLVMWTDYENSGGGEVGLALSRVRHWLPLPCRLEDIEAALRAFYGKGARA